MIVRIRPTDHLAGLLERAHAARSRLSGALPQTPPERLAALVAQARRDSARSSVRLDGSPLEPSTADDVDRREQAGAPARAVPAAPATGGWARVLRIDDLETQDIAAAEYANALACFDTEVDVAPILLSDPEAAIHRLHGALCRGLVAPSVVGMPRRTDRAVHDGAQGKVVYNAPAPEAVPGLLTELWGWIADGAPIDGAPTEPLLASGVLHERLLDWQPFEAANGRLARAASRTLLRATGVDPHGLAVAERVLVQDPLGYHQEVAATRRRGGDVTAWVERHLEAVTAGLEVAVAALDLRGAPAPPPEAVAAVSVRSPGERFTIAAYARDAEVATAEARRHLALLEAAGLVVLEPGSRGLRYRRSGDAAGSPDADPI